MVIRRTTIKLALYLRRTPHIQQGVVLACIKFIQVPIIRIFYSASNNRHLRLKTCFRTCFRVFLGIIKKIRFCYKTEMEPKKEAETYKESITLCF